MKHLVALAATAALAWSGVVCAEAERMVGASVDAVEAAVARTFDDVGVKMVDMAVMFVHGTAVGTADSGTRVTVSFTRMGDEGTKVVVTTDGPEDSALEEDVLAGIVAAAE